MLGNEFEEPDKNVEGRPWRAEAVRPFLLYVLSLENCRAGPHELGWQERQKDWELEESGGRGGERVMGTGVCV